MTSISRFSFCVLLMVTMASFAASPAFAQATLIVHSTDNKYASESQDHLFELSGDSLSPFSEPLTLDCSFVYCAGEARVNTSFAGVPANNAVGVYLFVKNSRTGALVSISPFNSVSIYSSTVDGGNGTMTGQAVFHFVVPNGCYTADIDIALTSTTGGVAGIAASGSQDLTVSFVPIAKPKN